MEQHETKTLRLNDGNSMPRIGMGFYQVPEGEDCETSLKTGLQMGYRLIDTAAAYQNERSIGKAIRESGVKREEIFLTTKLWVQDYGFENAKRSIDGALKRLGLEYVDLLLLHRPAGDAIGAYRALEAAKKEGKIRSIGVCNHTTPQLTALMRETSVVPAVNQVECHPLQQQLKLRRELERHGIVLESWFPLGHGSKRLRLNETLGAIAEKHGKSLSQVILRWHLQEGFVVIPKSSNPGHMRENLDLFSFRLSDGDMAAIRALHADRYLGGDPEDPEKMKEWEQLRFEF